VAVRRKATFRRVSSGDRQIVAAVSDPTLQELFLVAHRLLAPIGNVPPAEAEDRYYAMLNEQ